MNILIPILVIVGYVAFGRLKKKYEKNIFDKGVNWAVTYIYNQAVKGDVSLTLDNIKIVLTKKNAGNQLPATPGKSGKKK